MFWTIVIILLVAFFLFAIVMEVKDSSRWLDCEKELLEELQWLGDETLDKATRPEPVFGDKDPRVAWARGMVAKCRREAAAMRGAEVAWGRCDIRTRRMVKDARKRIAELAEATYVRPSPPPAPRCTCGRCSD